MALVLLLIIAFNFQPNRYILGNDNYSPELNPGLTLERSIVTPAWRSYRALGIASDSEQADVFRALIETAIAWLLPNWLISQLLVFALFFIASYGAAELCGWLANRLRFSSAEQNLVFLFGGLFYCANLITAWMFFSPLLPFIFGYALLPLLLWRLGKLYEKRNAGQAFIFLLTVFAWTTAAVIATTFVVQALLLGFFLVLFGWLVYQPGQGRRVVITGTAALVLFILSQLFWLLPFAYYVRSNRVELQSSYANRVLTPSLIEQENRYDQFWNIPRFYFSWLFSIDQNRGTFQVPYHDWYTQPFGQILSYLVLVCAALGIIKLVCREPGRRKLLLMLVPLGLSWLIIKGDQPPLGNLAGWLAQTIPLYEQVFRWPSSKLFPALLIPLVVFASIGVVGLIGRLRRGKTLMTVGVVVALFVYVVPFWRGELIGSRGKVIVPEAYFHLRDFLKTRDPTERVYVAPEANSLYFHSYAWGFFGSSFLNYLLPNPLIEKALVTGSADSETAQQVLESAYYAENPDLFAQTLRHYQTPWVLLDKSSAPLDNGYAYDWEAARVAVEDNSQLSLVWKDQQLALYRIKDQSDSTRAQPMLPLYFDQNQANLQPMLNLDSNQSQYYSDSQVAGIIYPLALNFDTIVSAADGLRASATYHGPTADYSYPINTTTESASPTTISYDRSNQRLLLSPALPRLQVGPASYPGRSGSQSYHLPSDTQAISLGDAVYWQSDLINHDVTAEMIYQQAVTAPVGWDGALQTTVLSRIAADQFSLNVTHDTVMRLALEFPAVSAGQLELCVYSQIYQRCINRQAASAFFPAHQLVRLAFNLPVIVPEHDRLDLYLKLSGNGNRVDAVRVTADWLQTHIVLVADKSAAVPVSAQAEHFRLNTGDRMTLVIPKLVGDDAYHFQAGLPLMPNLGLASCQTTPNHDGQASTRQAPGQLIFDTSGDCSQTLELRFQPLAAQPLGLIYYQGKNTSGIPLKVSLRDTKEERDTFVDQFLYQDQTAALRLFYLPDADKTYRLDLYNYSISRHHSQTALEQLSFQPLPPAWYGLRLWPDQLQTVSAAVNAPVRLVTINQAYQSNWRLSGAASATPVRVNGWQQGWLIEEGSVPNQLNAWFWPNWLSWFGYGVDLILTVGLLVAVMRQRHLH